MARHKVVAAVSADLRIYVILPETVQIPENDLTPGDIIYSNSVEMEPGRLAAQCAHVVSKMRVKNHIRYGDQPITTIVLSVRNSRELEKVGNELHKLTRITAFHDVNPNFYPTDKKVLTAICTVPVPKDLVDDAIGHLPLWGPAK